MVGSLSEVTLGVKIAYGVLGSILGIIAFSILLANEKRTAAAILVVFYVAGWLLIAGPWSLHSYETRKDEAITAHAAQIQQEYASTRLYLKESVVEPGIWGEVKGNFSGFLLVSGNIYGKIDSGRVITVVYQHPYEMNFINTQYEGKHLAYSKPLSDIVIETIPAGTRPYLAFPEAFIAKDAYSRMKVYPWKPHLYLPEGWTIL